MVMTISGSGTIAGLVAGGLPDATVTAPDLASGAARTNFGAGAVLQIKSVSLNSAWTTSATSWTDVTGSAVSITPSSATSLILVLASVTMSTSGTTAFGYARLVRNGTPIGVGNTPSRTPVSFFDGNESFTYSRQAPFYSQQFIDSPATTSTLTYSLQGYTQSGNTLFLGRTGDDAASDFPTIPSVNIVLMEIAA